MGRYFLPQVMVVLPGIGMRSWGTVVPSRDGCLAPGSLEYLCVGSEQHRTSKYQAVLPPQRSVLSQCAELRVDQHLCRRSTPRGSVSQPRCVQRLLPSVVQCFAAVPCSCRSSKTNKRNCISWNGKGRIHHILCNGSSALTTA